MHFEVDYIAVLRKTSFFVEQIRGVFNFLNSVILSGWFFITTVDVILTRVANSIHNYPIQEFKERTNLNPPWEFQEKLNKCNTMEG